MRVYIHRAIYVYVCQHKSKTKEAAETWNSIFGLSANNGPDTGSSRMFSSNDLFPSTQKRLKLSVPSQFPGSQCNTYLRIKADHDQHPPLKSGQYQNLKPSFRKRGSKQRARSFAPLPINWLFHNFQSSNSLEKYKNDRWDDLLFSMVSPFQITSYWSYLDPTTSL